MCPCVRTIYGPNESKKFQFSLIQTGESRGRVVLRVFCNSNTASSVLINASTVPHRRPYRSATWVMALVQILEPFCGDMGINLCRGQTAVTEQHLHNSKIGIMVYQMRRKGMT